MTSKKEQQRPKFAILMPWGRVGSNMVVSTLKKQGNIPIQNEPTTAIVSNYGKEEFSDFDVDRRQIELIAEFETEMKAKKAAIAYGMKISHRSLISPMLFYNRLAAEGYKAVCMTRDNIVKCAVSQIRAEKRARDLAKKGKAASWAVTVDEKKPGPSKIDPDRVVRLAKHFANAQSYVKQYTDHCFGAESLHIEYADLAQDPTKKITEIIEFIGIEQNEPVEIGHRKATSDDLSKDISNWDEFYEFIKDTPYAKYL